MTTAQAKATSKIDPSGRALRRAARGSVLNLASMVVTAVATFGLTIAVTRLTSPAEAGVFFSATSLFLIATGLGRLGTETGLVYFLSGARSRGELHHARAYMRAAALPVLLVSLVMAGAMALFSEQFAQVLSPGHERAFSRYLYVLAVAVPAAAGVNLALAATRGLGNMRPTAMLEHIARPVLQLILVVAGLVLVGAGTLSWAWGAVYVPLSLFAWIWWVRLRNRAAPQRTDPEFHPARSFWRFSWPRALAGMTQVAAQRLDIILVAALAGLPQAAVYAALTRFITLGQMAARAVSLSVEPLLGEALARANHEEAKSLYQATTAWVVLVTWPLYLLLFSFGSVALHIFGEFYSTGERALIILSGAMLVATACGMVNTVLLMAGKSFWNLADLMISFGVNLTLALALIPRIGLLGAALGWAAGILVLNLLPLAQIYRWFGLHPFGRASLLAIGTASTAYLLFPLLTKLIWGSGLGPILGATAGGTLIYLGLLATLRRHLQLDLLFSAIIRRRRASSTLPSVKG